jgi:hypothetical protein
MQAKANEPIVSIERFCYIGPLHAMPCRGTAISRTFETACRTRALFTIISNLFAQSSAQLVFS